MINTYHGHIAGKRVSYFAGSVVEGEHAEFIYNHQPTWCEVMPEGVAESGTEEQNGQGSEAAEGQAAGEVESEAVEETPQEVGEKSEGDEGMDVKFDKSGPPMDKMMARDRGKVITKTLDAMNIAELRELAKKKGVTGASRMKKAEIIERIREVL